MTDTEPLVERLRERFKLKYMSGCKCGKCHLVPLDLIGEAAAEIEWLTRERDEWRERSRSNAKEGLRARKRTEAAEAELTRLRSPPAVDKAGEATIYMASKAKHAEQWCGLRDSAGVPIISTWIDEGDNVRDYADLWRRCISEAAAADCTIVYHEPGEVLKGALVEAGAALASGRRVIFVGTPPGTWMNHANVSEAPSIEAALAALRGQEGAE